jgi:uncharacterized protein YraI
MQTPHTLTRRQLLVGAACLAATLAVSPSLIRGWAAAATGDLYATTTDLRLRSGPGLAYSTIAILSTGTQVYMVEWGPVADGYKWMKASARVGSYQKDIATGYVASEFLRPLSYPAGDYTEFPAGTTVRVDTGGGGANLRSTPMIATNVIRVIPNGTTGSSLGLETKASEYRWLNVSMGGTEGWMATVVLATGSASQPAAFPIGSTVFVNTDSLNLRSGTSVSTSVLAVLPFGTGLVIETAPVQGDGRTWYGVRTLSDTSGWVAAEYLAGGNPEPAFAVGDAVRVVDGPLNLRSGSGLRASVLQVMDTNTVLLIKDGPVSRDGYTWYQVWNYGAFGWAAGEYLAYEPAGFPGEEGGP